MTPETKSRISAARREEDAAAATLANFTTKLKDVQNGLTASSKKLAGLEARRLEVIEGIGHGVTDESDLQRLRKALHAHRSAHEDLEEILASLQNGLFEAEKEQETAKDERAKAERRAWREVAAELARQYQSELQVIFSRLHACETLAMEPSLVGVGLRTSALPGVLHNLMRVPNPNEVQQLKAELMEEFF